MAIVLDLINDALKQIGALGVGETASAAEAADALALLNDMLDSWRTESLLVYAMTPQVFTFTAGQAAYTIGVGGNWNIERPDGIDAVYARDAQGNDFRIEVTRNFEEYANIVSKQVTTNLPRIAYDDGDFPLRRLTFWPVPSDTTYSPVIWTWDVVTTFATVNDVLSLPPGYKLAIQTNLAMMMCPRYGIRETRAIDKQAAQAKAQVKRANAVTPNMSFPSGLVTSGRWFNYLTGETS